MGVFHLFAGHGAVDLAVTAFQAEFGMAVDTGPEHQHPLVVWEIVAPVGQRQLAVVDLDLLEKMAFRSLVLEIVVLIVMVIAVMVARVV